MLENIPTTTRKSISTPGALGGVVLGLGMSLSVLTGSAGAIVVQTGVEPPPRLRESSPPFLAATATASTTPFASLADRWERETASTSSDYGHYVIHPAYLRIIAMGWAAVPCVLERLAAAPDHWGTALEAITGENPVPMDAAGDMIAIADAWLAWGRARGLLA